MALLWFVAPCRNGSGATCRLSQAESERRCRAPGQPPGVALCHGRGRCDCGVCICQVNEPGVYFGPVCECHEWVCETYDGRTCAGKGGRYLLSVTHQLVREQGNTFFWGFCHFPQGEKGRDRPLLTGPSRKLEVIAICDGILLLVNSGIVL